MGVAGPGHEVAGGRRTADGVRGGNCLAATDVVRMSVVSLYDGVCNQGSSCPTGGSVSVKGNRP